MLLVGIVRLIAGCGSKTEPVTGADKMSVAEKKEKVQEYCKDWVDAMDASLKEKGLDVFPATFTGVEAERKGCDLELGELSRTMRAALNQSSVVGLLNPAPGNIKVKVRYLLPASGDPAKAKCRISVACGAAGSPGHIAKYYPDPRIFAIYLPDDKKPKE
ncbi:MAG: hypothetical protein ACLFWL_12985 [Candidatus Brocadiia bacterium]